MSSRLLLHHDTSSVIADTFGTYANAYERALLYGKEVVLFYPALDKGAAADQAESLYSISYLAAMSSPYVILMKRSSTCAVTRPCKSRSHPPFFPSSPLLLDQNTNPTSLLPHSNHE